MKGKKIAAGGKSKPKPKPPMPKGGGKKRPGY
jgi:hypothetical protein